MNCGTVADCVNAVAAVLAVVVAAIALVFSLRIDNKNSKLLKRQIRGEYVYWHVYPDTEDGCFKLRNIGTDKARNVKIHAFIDGRDTFDTMRTDECDPGEVIKFTSDAFFNERDGAYTVFERFKPHIFAEGINMPTQTLTVKFLVEWKDSMGFSDHQEITTTFD